MYSFSNFELVHRSMSGSNCWFLTCIQISQEADKVVCYSHLFKNGPQFVVIHTVKGFSVVNEAEVDVFLEFSCFFYDPTDVGNLSLVPLPFLNPAWASGSSWFKYSWRLAWRILSRMNFEHIPVSYDEKDILNPRWWNRRICIFSCENSKLQIGAEQPISNTVLPFMLMLPSFTIFLLYERHFFSFVICVDICTHIYVF